MSENRQHRNGRCLIFAIVAIVTGLIAGVLADSLVVCLIVGVGLFVALDEVTR